MEIPEGLDARESLPPLESAGRLMSFEDFTDWEAARVREFQGSNVPEFQGSVVQTLFDAAGAAVTSPLPWPAAPGEMQRAWSEFVEPAWASFASVVDRYLAAKLFASWAAYLGDGTQAVMREVEIALAVLKAAIRQSDLLLLHYADRAALAVSALSSGHL